MMGFEVSVGGGQDTFVSGEFREKNRSVSGGVSVYFDTTGRQCGGPDPDDGTE